MMKLWGRLIVSLFVSLTLQTAKAAVVPGEYLVTLKPGARGLTTAAAFVRSKMHRGNILIVRRASFESASSAITALKNDPAVQSVESNQIFRTLDADAFLPDLTKLWQFKTQTVSAADLQIQDAWQISTGSPDVIVAVLDTGIDYNHPDLRKNMWTNEAELDGEAGVDDDGNGYVDDVHGYNFVGNNGDPMDDGGHGTHCAGSIGATGMSGHGMVGVNRDVRLMALKFLDAVGYGTTEDAIRAIDYAVLMGARVLSNSWGGVDEESLLLKEAIMRAHKAGVLFVAAAGNIHNDNDKKKFYPAGFNLPNMVTVASIAKDGSLAETSSYGFKSVDLAAPGVDIYSTSLKDGYEVRSGTSMAAPFVSGVAALVLAAKPGISHFALKRCLINSVTPLSSLEGMTKTGGTLNAYGAVTDDCKKKEAK